MTTTEEMTPLVLPGPFFLPVIYPPGKILKNPLAYYGNIADHVKVEAKSTSPADPLEIRVDGIDYVEMRKVDNVDVLVKAEDVYALTAGFATFEKPDQVLLRLWPTQFKNLAKSPIGQRPNRVAYGSLDPNSVKTAFEKHIGELALAVLQESWSQKNSGSPPADPALLKTALLNRFLAGDASLFVAAGAVLGTGKKVANSMTLTIACFFDPVAPLPSVTIPAEDLIDNARQPGRLYKFGGHPLVKAISEIEVTVRFQSQFQIWNNVAQAYEPFAGKPVTLLASPPLPLVPEDLIPTLPLAAQPTDPAGRIDLTVALPSRATIRFRYATTGVTLGNRTFGADIETDPHPARSYVDSDLVNRHAYRAKYEIYPGYQAFLDDIVDRGNFETVEKDRGNADGLDRSRPGQPETKAIAAAVLEAILPDRFEPRIALSQRELHAQIAGFEAFYKLDVIPPKEKTFNLLCEGDSWTNYPLALNDLYSHLDALFQRKLKDGMSYNRIPLQHHGDRGQQMFVASGDGQRQFDFTTDFLREYKIDLILCSAGGNDFAEPGISADFAIAPFDEIIANGGHYFDPYQVEIPLDASQQALAKTLMERSFAVLLKNHPWNLFARGVPKNQLSVEQKDAATLRAELDPLLAQIGDGDFGYTPERINEIEDLIDQIGSAVHPQAISDPEIRFFCEKAVELTREAVWAVALRTILQEIGSKVIAKFPADPPAGSPAAQLLATVFDTGTATAFFDRRYHAIEQHWRILLEAAKPLGIPVISHTYGYPLFSESPASVLGLGRDGLTGPWFTHRFAQAHLLDRRVQKMCLKAFLDHFERTVFQKFKSEYHPLFAFVNSRDFNSEVGLWRDELHLRAAGFKKIAEAIFTEARLFPGVMPYFWEL